MAEHYEVGDIVKLKKPHPCGSSEWEILRVGADFRLKCTSCQASRAAIRAINSASVGAMSVMVYIGELLFYPTVARPAAFPDIALTYIAARLLR